MQHTQSPRHKRPLLIVIIVAVILAAWGIGSRVVASYALRTHTDEEAIPTVSVIAAPSGAASEEIVLPGNVQAWHEAPIYARTSGYVKTWYTGMGTKVKEGDLLAEIETPEIDAQYRQAQADLATAVANNTLSQSTAKRWEGLLKTDSVSKQEADEKKADALAKQALVAAAQANVDRLHDLESFKRVVAPFDGTITSRTTDIGELINAGSNNGQPMFHIAQADKLRIYVQVPERYAPYITPKVVAKLRFNEYPGREFPVEFLKTAEAIAPATRTLLTEFKADNSNGELFSGGYVEVHITADTPNAAVLLPVNTLIFRSSGLQIATIDGDSKVALKDIKINRDFGKEVEISAGIAPGEKIVVNPPDSLRPGQEVHVVEAKKDEKKDDNTAKDDKKPEEPAKPEEQTDKKDASKS